MAKVYSVTGQVEEPSFVWKDRETYDNNIKTYMENVKEYLNELGYNTPETGKVIRFPVGDGYAEYMVASLKPAVIVHLEIGDCWQFQYDYLLTAKEIKQELERSKALEALFSKH